MPIIAKPVNIEKNVAALFTLDKSALAVLPSVSSDAYFSNSTNWNRVLLFYKSSVGNQKKILKFDATQVSPTSNFLASNKARNIFEIQKILIVDFDNGIFEVPRSQLTVSEFDVDMTSVSYTNWDFASLEGPYYSLNPQNELVSNFSSLPLYSWQTGPWMLYSLDTFAIGNNGLQMVVKAEHGLINVNFNQFLGVCDANKGTFSGFFRSEYGDNAPLVQNYAQNQYYDYPYPSSSPNNEIIFKLVITTSQTTFYWNDQIVHVRNVPVLSGATASTLVRLCTRFTNEYKIKEVIVTSL